MLNSKTELGVFRFLFFISIVKRKNKLLLENIKPTEKILPIPTSNLIPSLLLPDHWRPRTSGQKFKNRKYYFDLLTP